LMPRRRVEKQHILEAYRQAAKKFHPDSTSSGATACATTFRQCHEARSILLEYYKNHPNRMMDFTATAAASQPPTARQKPFDPLAPWRTSRTRRVTFGVKALVLLAAACDGFVTKRRRRRRRMEQEPSR
jgi:hypothetical protein